MRPRLQKLQELLHSCPLTQEALRQVTHSTTSSITGSDLYPDYINHADMDLQAMYLHCTTLDLAFYVHFEIFLTKNISKAYVFFKKLIFLLPQIS